MVRIAVCIVLSSLFLCSHILPMPEPAFAARVMAQVVLVRDDVRVSLAIDPDPHDETSIAVSAIDPQVIVGASKGILGGSSGLGATRVSYYYSSDGGNTWGTGLLQLDTPQKVFSRASDPSVVADADGNFYLCALMLDNSSFDNGVYVFKSTDRGRTFSQPVPAFLNLANPTNPKLSDKCYITIDTSPSSPFKNTVYAVWSVNDVDDMGVPRGLIQISRRRPGDAAFSEPKTLSHNGDMRGPSVATGPNGEVYIAWEGIGSPKVLLFNASTDGGVTFLPNDVAPSTDYNIHNYIGSLSEPRADIHISGVPRMNSFPVIAVDRSGGPNRGTVYVAWAESTNHFDSDIFVQRMTPPNGGRPEISPPVKVNNDGFGVDQFFPWLSVDSNNGSVCVAFYDRRGDPSGILINTYLARSTDGGASFAENTRVSTAGTDPRVQKDVVGSTGSAIGIGDYIGVTATGGKAHLLWADTRNGKQEIFYGQVEYASTGGGGNAPANDACQNARLIPSVPFREDLDTRSATGSASDPISCSAGRDSNSVWYAITASTQTVYGVDTILSDYDTVVSVYTGSCGALTPVRCSDDFGSAIGSANRSLLTFPVQAGVTYLIEVSGKGSGGALRLRVGAPTTASVEYKTGLDGSKALKITGAGFILGSATVSMSIGGTVTDLPTLFFQDPLTDGTATTLFASKKKLKKMVKPGVVVTVTVESPAGSSSFALPFTFSR